jgi:subtilisin
LKSRLAFVLAGVLLAAVAGVTTAASTPPPERYIVVLKENGVDPGTVAGEHRSKHGVMTSHVYRSAFKGYAAEVPHSKVEGLRADPRIDFLSPVYELETFAQTMPTGIDRIDGDASSVLSGDGAGSLLAPGVAIIDTGIDPSHPDLNVVGGVNCSGRGKAGDFADYDGHGSHVAGIAAARDNGVGVVGVAPGAPLYAVRVLARNGRNTTAEAACGVDWVTRNAASIGVANMSLGYTTAHRWVGSDDGNCGRTNNDAMHLAICRSVEAGVTYVVAAGNAAVDFKGTAPAAFDEVLTVTAMADFNGQPGGGAAATCRVETDDAAAVFSNYTTDGNAWPNADAGHTIAAPGVCIYSTDRSGRYSTKSGTSMASPAVTGAVALCLSPRPDGTPGPCAGMTPSQIIAKLRTDAAARASTPTTPYYGFSGDPTFPTSGRFYGSLVFAGGY